MNIQQFLEREKEIDYQLVGFDKEDESWSVNEERLKERDARLINFVLSEVEKEVGKYSKKMQGGNPFPTEGSSTAKDILALVGNLRVEL